MISEETWIAIGALIVIGLVFVFWYLKRNFGYLCFKQQYEGPVTNLPPSLR
jgi:hypothetical protein